MKAEILSWAEGKGVAFRYKDESLFMKLLGKLLFFNKAFMTRFTTTIGSTIYFPSRQWHAEKDAATLVSIVAHEVTHVMDNRRMGTVKYVYSYLSPQLNALGALIALASIWAGAWWLLGLGFLAFAAPWGSKGRTDLEMRGYATSMAVAAWVGSPYASPPDWIVDQFTGPSYYFMCPNQQGVQDQLAVWIAKIEDDTILKELEHLVEVKEICMGQQ